MSDWIGAKLLFLVILTAIMLMLPLRRWLPWNVCAGRDDFGKWHIWIERRGE